MSAIDLEMLLTHEDGFALTTATPVQRAVCRILDGLPLADLAADPDVIQALGGPAAVAQLPPGVLPTELLLLAGIRGGKSLIAAAAAVRASQICDLSRLGPGEVARVSVVSLTTDLARVVYGHLRGRVEASPLLRELLLEEPTSDSLLLRHPSGRPVEVKVVAGAKAGASLVARWSAGVVFDECARMVGADDGVINLDDARAAVLGRLLPGAQAIYISSPWAPFGPVYERVTEHFGQPTAELVVMRATGPMMNPTHWTKGRCEKLRLQDPTAYRTDVEGLFADPEQTLFSSVELDRATRLGPMQLPRAQRISYVAAMDPGTRGNAWTLVIVAGIESPNDAPRYSVALARQWVGSKITPLSPESVLKEIAGLVAQYGLNDAWTDQYAADALRDIASRHGLELYEHTITAPRKLELFDNLRTLLATEALELPPDPVLRGDLLSVRRRVTQSGVSIVLPRTSDGRHADYAAALAIAMHNPPDPPSDELPEQTMDPDEARIIARLQAQKSADPFEAAGLRLMGRTGLF